MGNLNWSNLTLSQFIQANQINSATYENNIDREINLFALITGKQIEEIEQMPITDLRKELTKLSFMNKLPDKRIPKRFIHGGKVWDVNLDMTKLTGGQVIDIMNFYGQAGSDVFSSANKFLSIVCIPRKSFFRVGKYTGKDFEKNSKLMLDLTMDKAYPIMLFFSKVGESLLPTIENFLQQKVKELKMDILNNGAGLKH